MRTLVISDMHLGAASGAALLSRSEPRAALFEALSGVDRLVLLGDVLELRHGPRRDALAAARPFFEELGRVFAGGEIVVVAGNHDHALVESWLRGREESSISEPLALEQRFSAGEASSMVAAMAEWAAPARLSAAYPGLWVRSDVYATHGHYLDCHLTVPTMERLGIALTGRVLGRSADSFTGVADYEAVTAPVFAWIDAVARQAPTGSTLNGQSTVRVWRALSGAHDNGGGVLVNLRTRALAGAFPMGIAALNRVGIGTFNADISASELRRAGLRAMGEVATHLELGDAYVIFGHTHRAGPLGGDDVSEWRVGGDHPNGFARGASGARLFNAGCWTYDSYFVTKNPGESPYWPGGGVLVEDGESSGPPVLLRLLDDYAPEDLMPLQA